MDQHASRTDAELLRAARTDADAFVVLYDRYARAAAGWAARAGIPEADVLDVVAELFAQAWRSRARFRDPGDGNAAAWLYGIGRHIAAHHHRTGRVQDAARRRLGLIPDGAGVAGDGPEAGIGAHPELETALAALPPAQAAAVRLRVIEDLDYGAIGDRLSCTPVAARKHVSLGLSRLRCTLDHGPETS